ASIATSTTHSFSNVQATHTISTTFSAIPITTFNITASAGTNGAISPTGVTSIAQGANQTYIITPASGYQVATLTVDGTSIATSTTYTFTNAQMAHTINATFSLIPVLSTIPTPSAPIGGSCVADVSTEYFIANYYVDATAGSDANNGLTSGTAWKSLSKALSSAPAGSIVFVAGGDYGALQETVPVGRTSYLTIRATPGASPRLSKINIDYVAKSPAFLRVVGFTIKNYDYDPNNGQLVNIADATDIELLNNTISSDSTRGSGYAIASLTPGNPSTIDGIGMNNTERVTIKSNCVSGVLRGIQLAGSTNISLFRNYISPQAGTGIQYLSNNVNVLIEDNHIRGMIFTPYCNFVATPYVLANCDPATTPLDPNAILDPHASVISIRSNDVTIRNNIMHGMGSSSGIMFYLPDAAGGRSDYSNITIEGNLLYDITNTSVLRFYGVADNLIVRNNMVVSQYSTGTCATGAPISVTNDARYLYSSALTVSSLATGKNGSGLSIANNVFVGASFMGGSLPTEKNNIFWSYSPSGAIFSASSLSGTSKVVTSAYLGCGVHSPYFDTGFFATTPNFIPKHGLLYNYRLAPTSQAVGFGDTSSQLLRKLGAPDANNFFINSAGNRSATEHSAGPYEP
ncbi:MAG: right-handed parallel beta-helix repeat-containing protein, partial [Minisyncoccia bacterium]